MVKFNKHENKSLKYFFFVHLTQLQILGGDNEKILGGKMASNKTNIYKTQRYDVHRNM